MGKLRMAKLGKSATHLLALAEEHDSPKSKEGWRTQTGMWKNKCQARSLNINMSVIT